MAMKDLHAEAKALGIKSFGMTKVVLEAAIAAYGGSADPDAIRIADEAPADARAERPTTRDQETPRRRRVPLGVPRLKLSYPPIPGYQTRWFNDNGNRVKDAIEGGWEFVFEDDDGRDVKVSRRVGVNDDGSPMMGFLMKIRTEFYNEDQALKQQPLDDFDAQLRGGQANPQGAEGADRAQFYTPREGVSISHDN